MKWTGTRNGISHSRQGYPWTNTNRRCVGKWAETGIMIYGIGRKKYFTEESRESRVEVSRDSSAIA